MALTAAICTQCGAQIQVDETKEAGICPSCGTAFITEKVIHNFVTNNNFAGATINVQGGTSLQNLYTLARRALKTNKIDDIIRYYGQIREQVPNDWEAEFYYSLFEPSANIEEGTNLAYDLAKNNPEHERQKIYLEITDMYVWAYSNIESNTKGNLWNMRDKILSLKEPNIDINESLYLIDYALLKFYNKDLGKKNINFLDKEIRTINPQGKNPADEAMSKLHAENFKTAWSAFWVLFVIIGIPALIIYGCHSCLN